jgi:hypothetical protein
MLKRKNKMNRNKPIIILRRNLIYLTFLFIAVSCFCFRSCKRISNYENPTQLKIPPIKIEFEIHKIAPSELLATYRNKEKIPILPPWKVIKRIKNLAKIKREIEKIVQDVHTKFLKRCPYLTTPIACSHCNELELN